MGHGVIAVAGQITDELRWHTLFASQADDGAAPQRAAFQRHTKPRVVIAGQDLPAGLVKEGTLDSVDLTLLSVDAAELPLRLRMRRMPLCERAPYAGETVVVVIPEGTARSRVVPPQAIPAELRGRFGTAIADVATTGNSGSGVFDGANLCLLGIISRKISISLHSVRFGGPVAATRDIAKYFVPASEIKAFIPPGVTY